MESILGDWFDDGDSEAQLQPQPKRHFIDYAWVPPARSQEIQNVDPSTLRFSHKSAASDTIHALNILYSFKRYKDVLIVAERYCTAATSAHSKHPLPLHEVSEVAAHAARKLDNFTLAAKLIKLSRPSSRVAEEPRHLLFLAECIAELSSDLATGDHSLECAFSALAKYCQIRGADYIPWLVGARLVSRHRPNPSVELACRSLAIQLSSRSRNPLPGNALSALADCTVWNATRMRLNELSSSLEVSEPTAETLIDVLTEPLAIMYLRFQSNDNQEDFEPDPSAEKAEYEAQ
ncbi:hypothetical protein BJ742DRAFT_787801 [Cladochytrium replicatum]|nr:hypothetical protein BJ742DRAFT_787801 [Cladochytrium replicatum]